MEAIEVRLDHKGELDEVVHLRRSSGHCVHLERMDDCLVWIGMNSRKGESINLHVQMQHGKIVALCSETNQTLIELKINGEEVEEAIYRDDDNKVICQFSRISDLMMSLTVFDESGNNVITNLGWNSWNNVLNMTYTRNEL